MSTTTSATTALPRIVIVGGGAGGLELATRLGKTLGKKKQAEITLVDCSQIHIWKPLLHEVAAGTMDSHDDELAYLAQARANHFRFVLGRMDALYRDTKQIRLASMNNAEGDEIVPVRTYGYDILVMAIGSLCNDFGIPGVAEHCQFLDSTEQAEHFQQHLLAAYLRAQAQGSFGGDGVLDIAIIGGGATGIELSAQLHQATQLFNAYGLDSIQASDIKLHLIEASTKLLPQLPARLSEATAHQLREIGVNLLLGERVVEVTKDGVKTLSGKFIQAEIMVWAAGIKAPDFLNGIAGLESNRINQLVVKRTLQTTLDDDIYALGDCAACPWPEKGPEAIIPPRAQSAHQMANQVYQNIQLRLKGQAQKDYVYTDYGSLVALGKFSTVGNLMGNLMGSVMIEGAIARLVYLSLYKMHQMALFGPFRVGLMVISNFFRSRLQPKIKLH